MELLITTRYIEEAVSFFNRAEEIYAVLAAMSGQLDLWPHKPDTVEKWLLADVITRRLPIAIEGFVKLLKQAREKAAKRY